MLNEFQWAFFMPLHVVSLISGKWYIRNRRLPFPLLFCSTSGICNCLATREMAAVLLLRKLPKMLNSYSMKKQPQRARERYVSAEKLQQVFAQLGIELCAGRKLIRATQSKRSISIYVNGGTVNITFNEKGGKV